ncbi:hypothetical protein V502_02233, partial [Pseudogymnoascus sp. VKM F-4520 (FW-2644)]
MHFGSFVFRDELLCCNDESSPEDGKHPSIFPLCTVEADLTKVPKDLFVIATNSKGKQYYKVPYEIEMTFKSASIFFELVFEGISYGSVRANGKLSTLRPYCLSLNANRGLPPQYHVALCTETCAIAADPNAVISFSRMDDLIFRDSELVLRYPQDWRIR